MFGSREKKKRNGHLNRVLLQVLLDAVHVRCHACTLSCYGPDAVFLCFQKKILAKWTTSSVLALLILINSIQ